MMLTGCANVESLAPNFSVAAQSETVEPQQIVDDFMNLIIKKDRKSAESYLFDQMIQIPEIKKNTPIDKFVVLPTPQYNDTKVVVTYFKGEVGGELIAFIWELVVKNGKISRIKVIHDGTNPLFEEAKLIKEYELKFHRPVLVPSKFPFEVTGFDGYIGDDQTMTLKYRNESINGSLSIAVSTAMRELEYFKGINDEIYKLKNGTKVLYRAKFDTAYLIMFLKDGLHYTVSIGNKRNLKKEFTVNHLIQIAESMK
jgi:hypothetical protein